MECTKEEGDREKVVHRSNMDDIYICNDLSMRCPWPCKTFQIYLGSKTLMMIKVKWQTHESFHIQPLASSTTKNTHTCYTQIMSPILIIHHINVDVIQKTAQKTATTDIDFDITHYVFYWT